MPEVIAIIPARYESSRFPGKPLAIIHGKPMFWHVMHRASLCPLVSTVALATDDERILQAAREPGMTALMTSPDHASGTDRVLEAARLLGAAPDSVIVNVQGDEPALNPEMLTELVRPFDDPSVQVTTLGHIIRPGGPKAGPGQDSARHDGRALYFSRAPVPFGRDNTPEYIGHIGLYGLRMRVLEKFSALGESPLERLEKLEQLRLLEAGIPIHVALTRHKQPRRGPPRRSANSQRTHARRTPYMKAILALEDGTWFAGQSFTGPGEAGGEVIFNTGMSGYQEILTDPSYYGQMVCMTYPLIGNYGVNLEDVESSRIHCPAMIVKECCKEPSNWRSRGEPAGLSEAPRHHGPRRHRHPRPDPPSAHPRRHARDHLHGRPDP
jgi:3-deoxy-manno-octulosonate cytidylyltransferase (CMP-KDO synthetase)